MGSFVAPLPRWVLSWWRSVVALAIDPALKGKETTAIVISVVCRGCAIPVAWRIMRANKPGAWMDPVVELLQALAPAAPEEMKVIVLCGRGLTSPELWEQIRARSQPPAMTGGLASIHEVPYKHCFPLPALEFHGTHGPRSGSPGPGGVSGCSRSGSRRRGPSCSSPSGGEGISRLPTRLLP